MGDSLLHRLDPRTKLGLGVAFLVALFAVPAGAGLAVLGLGLLWLGLRSRLPLGYLLSGLAPLVPVTVLTIVFHALMTEGPGLARAPWISAAGLQHGLLLALRLIYLVWLTSLVSLTTSPIAMCDAVERLLSPMRRLGVPTHELALVATIALRFVPTLALEAERIYKAQLARGAPFESRNLLKRLRAYSSVLVPLFVRAFRYAEDLACAMEARGYQGGAGRTRLRELRLRGLDYLVGGLGLLACLALIGLSH